MVSVLLSAALGGCVVVPRAAALRPAEGLPTANLGGSAAAVFAGPGVAEAYRGVEMAALPEARRNNRHLSHRPVAAYTAIDAWPQRAQPDINRRRTINVFQGDRSFIFFVPPGSGVGGYRGPSGGPYVPGY